MADRIRILFLAANPKNSTHLRLDEEIREIQSRIQSAEFRNHFELLSRWAVRPDDLLQALNEVRPHIVHFSGHGSKSSQLILEDKNGNVQPVGEAALVALFRNLKDNIRLVLFNACHSESQANAISSEIECMVGMTDAIGDNAAITFASWFYGALAFGRSVGQAFDQGRTALMLNGIPEETTPILLTRPGVDALQITFIDQNSVNSALRQARESFRNVENQMPTLIAEMRQDLRAEGGESIREFFVMSKHQTHGGSAKRRFTYYDEDHDNLRGKIDVLENSGYIVDVTPKTVPIYRMMEEFVKLILDKTD